MVRLSLSRWQRGLEIVSARRRATDRSSDTNSQHATGSEEAVRHGRARVSALRKYLANTYQIAKQLTVWPLDRTRQYSGGFSISAVLDQFETHT
jgi:hypothetical protein